MMILQIFKFNLLNPKKGKEVICPHKKEPRNCKFGRFELDAVSACIDGLTPW